jgi:hypothetical protein
MNESGRLSRVGPSLRVAVAVMARPRLWRSAARLARPGWWRHWPPSPLPPTDYLRFRTQTMYGDKGQIDAADLVAYLEWCRRMGTRAR